MRTIESVAKYLLKQKVSFKYSSDTLEVTSSYYSQFRYASYHTETKQLVLMDGNYNQFDASKLK